eukprot:2931384-Rhodomonas_salina.2
MKRIGSSTKPYRSLIFQQARPVSRATPPVLHSSCNVHWHAQPPPALRLALPHRFPPPVSVPVRPLHLGLSCPPPRLT